MISDATDNNGQLPPLADRTGSGDGLKGIWTNIIVNDGYLPATNTKSGLEGTNAGVWACPDCEPTSRWHGGYGVAEGTVMQVMRGSVPGSGSARLAAIRNRERTWLVGAVTNDAPNLKTSWHAIFANPASWTRRSPAARHAGKVNVCMVDGHVESLTVKELRDPNKDYTMRK
jgi:prepilin-type processing-associated H-X9-DG protein